MWQAGHVRDRLQRAHPKLNLEIRPITTEGDRRRDRSLTDIGGRGVFIKEIEEALLADEIDIAVHSIKDVPTAIPEALTIAAIPEREDARDAFVTRDGLQLADLPSGAKVGTGSPRRRVQVLAMRPDVQLLDIRGNVDTRLRKLADEEYDAVVLAAAGLRRLGWESKISEIFSTERMVPAIGQGALGIECRRADRSTGDLLRSIDHLTTHVAVMAERAFLAQFGGGCNQPIGAYAWLDEEQDQLRITGMVAQETGPRQESLIGDPAAPEDLGTQLAEKFS